MPTPEEIKNLIKQYAKGTETKHFSAELIESIVMGFYNSRLKNDYCIVPKSKVKDEYEVAKSMIHSNKIIDQDCGIVRKLLMDYLFGTELFNEK